MNTPTILTCRHCGKPAEPGTTLTMLPISSRGRDGRTRAWTTIVTQLPFCNASCAYKYQRKVRDEEA
jgi:endogenous inhibitor of DNA gyrase (YacG/DUF329 family)